MILLPEAVEEQTANVLPFSDNAMSLPNKIDVDPFETKSFPISSHGEKIEGIKEGMSEMVGTKVGGGDREKLGEKLGGELWEEVGEELKEARG